MLRVHFTHADLACVSVSRMPGHRFDADLFTRQRKARRTPTTTLTSADRLPRIAAERQRRLVAVPRADVDTLLANLSRLLRWRPPVLYASYPHDEDLYLDGTGLLLVPSFGHRRTAVVLIPEPDRRPVLVYPVAPVRDAADQSLVALLGRTRAGVLHMLTTPCTTGELAQRAGVSPASASEHATVLRNAGLVTSTRAANAVLHALTPLGHALLGETPSAARGERRDREPAEEVGTDSRCRPCA